MARPLPNPSSLSLPSCGSPSFDMTGNTSAALSFSRGDRSRPVEAHGRLVDDLLLPQATNGLHRLLFPISNDARFSSHLLVHPAPPGTAARTSGLENRSTGADGTSTRHRSKLRRANSETDGTAEVRRALNPHPFREAEKSAVSVPEPREWLRAGGPPSVAPVAWTLQAIEHQRRPHALHGSFRRRYAVGARVRVFRQPSGLGSRFASFASDLFGAGGPAPGAPVRNANLLHI